MAESGTWHLIRQGDVAPFVVAGDVIVGRSKQADLRIQEGYVSRRHARLWLDAGQLHVEDLGSANGTFLNGERLSRPRQLLPGDCVCFDETEYYVEALAARGADDPNATTNSEDEDPEFPRPERPSQWQAASGVETQPPAPAPILAPPRAPRKAPSAPAEMDFDLEDADFDLTGSSGASGGGPRVPVPVPAYSAPASKLADTDVAFSLDGDGDGEGDDMDLSLGEARPDGGSLPSATVSMSPGPQAPSTVAMAPEDVPRPAPAAPRGDGPGLLFLSGPDEGVLYELVDGRVSIGRANESDIRIDESSISKRHAELLVQPGSCRIYDTSNSNGVFVNGDRVEDALLNPGDVIRLGRIEFTFDAYEKLAASGGGEESSPWLWLVLGFVGTAALASAAWVGLQLL